MKQLKLSKTAVLFGLFCVLVAGFIGVYFWENKKASAPPYQKVAQVFAQDVDTSKSLFTAEENAKFLTEIEVKLAEISQEKSVDAETVVDLGRILKNLHDYDKALQIYTLAETMNPSDLFFLIDKGQIYLEREQWELARQVFEPMKVTWPVHEAYLGLAEAYKHLDVPNYVIDNIYLESIDRNFAQFNVLEAYVEWLTTTGREDESIPYLEFMNRKVPQASLQEKIDALKLKYPNAKTLADVENQQ